MAGIDIQAKVKRGLSKAQKATGSASSPLVYLVVESGGGGTPSNPIAPVETLVLLVDAIFKDINQNNSSGRFEDLIQSGDRMLVSNGDVEVLPNQLIDVAGVRYLIVDVAPSNPAGVPLSYTSLIRDK